MIFILEDNASRLAAMLAVLADLFPTLPVHTEPSAPAAIAWLTANQPHLLLICLDHDLLPLTPAHPDPGTGRDVANHLTTQPPTCPIIIHTTNTPAGDGMFFALQQAHWPVFRVYPHNHDAWVPTDWRSTLQSLRTQSWLP